MLPACAAARGNHAYGALTGLKVGAIVGGGATAIIFGGAVLAAGAIESEAFAVAAVFTVSGAFTGALYGVIIGSLVGAETWTTLYTTPRRVSLVPAPGSAPGLGVRVSF